MGKKLTKRQQNFVDLYDGNGVETAKKAGYSGTYDTLGHVAAENLKKPHIVEAIKAREPTEPEKAVERKIKDREDLEEFWEGVMFNESAIEIVTLAGEKKLMPEVPWRERLKASEMIAKSKAVFITKMEVTGKDGGPVSITNPAITPKMSDKQAAEEYNKLLKDGK